MDAIENALEYVKSSPGHFFSTGTPNPIEIVTALAGDALTLGADDASVRRRSSWWFVGASRDWVQHSEFSVEQLFSRIVAFPEAGANSMRSEILVAAFADVVVTSGSDNERLVIKGRASVEDEFQSLSSTSQAWERVVGFKWAS